MQVIKVHKMSYDYTANTDGFVEGRRKGHAMGYAEAFQQLDPILKGRKQQVEQLTFELEEARQQLAEAQNEIAKYRHGFNSLLLITKCTADVLDDVPQLRVKAISAFSHLAQDWQKQGYIRETPLNDPALKERAPRLLGQLTKWLHEAITFAKQTTQEKKP
jgi:soluble cytochrome b562